MTHILILGAGFGGITAARDLRSRLPSSARITLVDQRSEFVMGLSNLWAMDGRRRIEAGQRALERLRQPGLEVMRGRVESIHPESHVVHISGRPYPYDRLVIALGAQLAPQALPGFFHAHNLYDAAAIPGLARILQGFEKGRILFVIASMPFKCPPAPYEAALLVASLLERRGVRKQCELELTTPEPRPLPVAPSSCGDDVKGYLKEKDIEYSPNLKPKAIHADVREVEFENGARKSYDLLIGVPPHRAPDVVRASGLTDASGWIPVNPQTLSTQWPDIYAVGDVAFVKTPSGKPLPKAGILAEAQARVVAANLAAELAGMSASHVFDGKGYCFIELGGGKATAVDGEFFALPEPHLTLRLPTTASLREKERFEAQRLTEWFGA